MTPRAFITGLSGPAITADERAFLRATAPWGLILFKRNVETPDQVKSLVGEFRGVVGRADAPVLIDQEGGRVQRLGPPQWPAYPPGAAYGRLHDRNPALGVAAAKLGARLIAADLAALGITVDCLPVADVPVPGSDAVIGDRAYGETPAKVAALAGAAAAGLGEGGVLAVLKHLPGHGRATADSHLRLPVVGADQATLESTDFAAFRPLARLAMSLLEPTAADSLAAWGFFNACFELKESFEPYVAEQIAREMLARDPQCAAEFEAKLANEPAFAGSPAARLEFFSRRHESWDERYNLYPIFRTDEVLG